MFDYLIAIGVAIAGLAVMYFIFSSINKPEPAPATTNSAANRKPRSKKQAQLPPKKYQQDVLDRKSEQSIAEEIARAPAPTPAPAAKEPKMNEPAATEEARSPAASKTKNKKENNKSKNESSANPIPNASSPNNSTTSSSSSNQKKNTSAATSNDNSNSNAANASKKSNNRPKVKYVSDDQPVVVSERQRRIDKELGFQSVEKKEKKEKKEKPAEDEYSAFDEEELDRKLVQFFRNQKNRNRQNISATHADDDAAAGGTGGRVAVMGDLSNTRSWQ